MALYIFVRKSEIVDDDDHDVDEIVKSESVFVF